MDDRRFDEIAKSFSKGNTRRDVLGHLGVGLAGVLAGAFGLRQEAGATHNPNHNPGGGQPACGPNNPCPTGPNTFCAVNTCVGTGTNAQCVLVPRNTGAVCRAASTACELDAVCVGTTCPANPFAPATRVCRAAAGDCDVAERCTGTSATCPSDAFLPQGTVCRAATAACEGPARCSGNDADCPANPFLPATTLCRTGVGGCDVSEFCTGSSRTCPADVTTPCGGAPNSKTICCKVGRNAGRCVAPQACTSRGSARRASAEDENEVAAQGRRPKQRQQRQRTRRR